MKTIFVNMADKSLEKLPTVDGKRGGENCPAQELQILSPSLLYVESSSFFLILKSRESRWFHIYLWISQVPPTVAVSNKRQSAVDEVDLLASVRVRYIHPAVRSSAALVHGSHCSAGSSAAAAVGPRGHRRCTGSRGVEHPHILHITIHTHGGKWFFYYYSKNCQE